MLYLTLLTPILALPAVLLMDRVERWASGGRPAQPRVAPMAPRGLGPQGTAATAGTSSAGIPQPAPSGSDPGSAPTEGGLSIMSPTPGRYSTTPMSRFQFLMLRAVEGGASLSEASDEALGWGVRHPDNDLFEHRPYAAWEAGRHDADHGRTTRTTRTMEAWAPSRKPSTRPGPDVWTEPSGEGSRPGLRACCPPAWALLPPPMTVQETLLWGVVAALRRIEPGMM